ncbi:cytochrome P450 [Sphingomonas sp. TF3]|uniref:cytochrome P450 n=1 Tax=Sphingomonas sp. TF3 TaxID=2495580 RepID=UPI000F8872AF|nr:cytochrome P450 [Sphingomonas sp. TF3]RUN76539.1 cytochrome P450 [Sphingomonas sp. TF3]
MLDTAETPGNDVQDAIVPADVAATVVAPKSYVDDTVIYPALAWLRDNVPLGKASVPGYDRFWLVTRYADVMAISRNAKVFINGDNNLVLNTQAGDAYLRQANGGKLRSMNSLAFMDRPEHAVYRSLTATSFMPGRIRKLEESIREIARASVTEMLAHEGEFDFVRDFAMHYPLRVISSMLGVPQEDEAHTLSLTQRLFGAPPPSPDGAAPTMDAAARHWRDTLEEFHAYFRELSKARRREPRDDLISLIANTKIEGEDIREDYELDYYVAIATAGHDTTTSSTAGGMLGMLKAPAQFAALKADPSLTEGFVDEAIRWSVPIKHFMRTANEDVVVSGQKIHAGDRLFLSYPSANRDADVYADGDAFDIRRSPNQHLSFGNGPHMCLGQHLAKLDMRVLFEELMPRVASIELAGEPEHTETNFIGGLHSLPVRFKAA